MPLISAVMPVLDPDPVYLRDAVRSVLQQTIEDIELIVVEDPARRTAEDVLAEIDDPRITFVRNAARTSHARQLNDAIARARSALIAQVDADDVWEPNKLELQSAHLREHPDVTVTGSWISIMDSSGALHGHRRYPTDHDSIVRSFRRFNALAHSTVVYRREAVVQAGGYTERIYPALDFDLWCRLARSGGRFANLAKPLVRYRVHPEGIKVQKLRATIRATQDIKRTYWSESMTVRDRMRLWGESLIAVLPAPVVLRLFTMTQYRKGAPV